MLTCDVLLPACRSAETGDQRLHVTTNSSAFYRPRRRMLCRLLLLTPWCLVAPLLTLPATGWAQFEIGAGRPVAAYYTAFGLLNDGNFDRAYDAFRNAARGGLITVNGRYVDSICYHTMMGESLFHQGNLRQALNSYNTALGVFLGNPAWMRRVQFPADVGPTNRVLLNQPNWGSSNRNARPAELPGVFQVLLGNPNLEQVVQQGGIVAPPEMHLIDVPEIIRCTTLALRRRRQILGPVCRFDPLSSRLLVAMEGRIGPANQWCQPWIDIQRAVAMTGLNKFDEAIPLLRRAITLGGQYDHPLTATALFELGNIAAMAGDAAAAESYFLEASLSAGYFDQITLVEESLTRAAELRFASGAIEPLQPLAVAGTWATRQRFRHLGAAISRLVAENLANAGESKAAIQTVERAKKTIRRQNNIAAQLAADLDYVTALASYQAGQTSVGAKALQSAIARQRACSTRLFQIQTADGLYRQNSDVMTDRIATRLYAQLLREPSATDWQTDPLETIAYTLSTDMQSYQNWMQAAIERKESATMVQVAEAIRQRRFAGYLPLGGRLTSLRWLMEADDQRLSDEHVQLRKSLRLKYPLYEQLSEAARDATRQLGEMPLAPDEEQQRTMLTTAAQLGATAKKQEQIIGTIALRREHCPTIFPPQRTLEQIQAGLSDRQVMLAFTATTRGLQAIMISREKLATWTIRNPKRVRSNVVSLLRSIGMHDDNSTLTAKQLAKEDWQKIAAKLTTELFEDAQLGFWNRFDELIVVPDDFLWYLPFEALIVEDNDESLPLISRMTLRYAPTMALAVSDSREKARDERTATVLGQMFPRDDPETAIEEFQQMQTVVTGLEALPNRLPVPTGILRAAWDRLLVLDDVGDARSGPLEWIPAKLESAKGDNSLARWLRLPWGAPDQTLLPGFHSAAESGLKRGADGDDLFVAVTALMASGTRTVIISRWRTGGQTSFELIREFMQESPHSSLPEAWQRSVQVVRTKEIDPRREPRIAHSAKDQPVKASHPFFWAGYLVADQGVPVDAEGKTKRPAEPSKAEGGI